MRKLSKYLCILTILLTSTAIDSPESVVSNTVLVSEFNATPKMVVEIQKLDSLEIRIDKLISGKLNK